jgi:thioredoxin 1
MELHQFKQITSSEFSQQVLKAEANAVVKLCSSWSGASQLLGYALSAMANDFKGLVDFYQVDIDSEPELSEAYRVELIPTLLFFRRGKLVDMQAGLTSRKVILSKLELLISNN